MSQESGDSSLPLGYRAKAMGAAGGGLGNSLPEAEALFEKC